MLTAIGFLSVYTARQNEISSASLTYAGVFLGVFGLAHIGVRAGLPNADPWLLPLAALLCALGLTEIYRLSPTLARDQSVWVVIGLLGFLGMVFLVRDHRRLEPYTYLLATTAVGLLLVTMAVGTTINGAKLWLRFGGVQVQPGEFAKLLLVVVPRELPARPARGADDGAPHDPRGRPPGGAPPGAARAHGRHLARRARPS